MPVAPVDLRRANHSWGVFAISFSFEPPKKDFWTATKVTRSQKTQVEFLGKKSLVSAPRSDALP
jgi:hypothetical protein